MMAASKSRVFSGRNDWVTLVNQDLEQWQNKAAEPEGGTIMFRVRPQLRELQPQHYAAEEFSFGLFDRTEMDPKTRSYECRLAMTGAALKFLGMEFGELCRLVVPEPKKIQDLYYEPERDPASRETDSISLSYVQSVMTLDAVFIACFLGSSFHEPFKRLFSMGGTSLSESVINPITADLIFTPLMNDLFKVENRFPLSLIRRVLDVLVKKAEEEGRPPFFQTYSLDLCAVNEGSNLVNGTRLLMKAIAHREKDANQPANGTESLAKDTLTAICKNAVNHLSYLLPGFDRSEDLSYTEGIPFDDFNNFLECMYRLMRNGMKQGADVEPPARRFLSYLHSIESSKHRWADWRKRTSKSFKYTLPSASELRNAGIEFRGYKGSISDVKFRKGMLKGTLYLPILNIDDFTEAIWRNLVAYEDWRLVSHKTMKYKYEFTHYLELMDKLIDTREDVMVLKSGRFPVIHGYSFFTSTDVTRIFNNGVLRNCVRRPSRHWSLLNDQIYNFYIQNHRRHFWEFKHAYFGNPWSMISVLAATGLLMMTFFQTYYTAAGYYALL